MNENDCSSCEFNNGKSCEIEGPYFAPIECLNWCPKKLKEAGK